MSKRTFDVTVSLAVILSVFALVILCTIMVGCAAMRPWAEPAAAATTQAINGPVGEAAKPLIPSPAREVVEAVALVAAAVLGHYRGQQVGQAKAASGPPGTATGV